MPYSSTYSMGTGVRWANGKTVDQYIGNDGIWPGTLLTSEKIYKLLEERIALSAALNKIAASSTGPTCALAIERARIAREALEEVMRE